MKLNISFPATGCQKLIEIEDEKKLRPFYDKRISAEVTAEHLGDEWKGYILKITGGNDKQGFPMKQGVLTTGRVKLLLNKGSKCYRPRRTGERKRKSVRGCIVENNLSVLALSVLKKGDQDIPGLTDTTIPRRLGPKRASKIRKLFNLSKEDDVRQYIVRRPLAEKEGKKKGKTKAPKIQRLVTPMVLQRKRHRLALKRRRSAKRRDEAAEYAKLLAQRIKEAKERKRERRRSASQSKSSISHDSISKDAAPKVAKVAKDKQAAKPAKPASDKSAAKPSGKPAPDAAKQAKKGAKPKGAKPKGAKPTEKGAKPSAKGAPAAKGTSANKAAASKPAAKSAKPAAGKTAGKPAAKSGKVPPKTSVKQITKTKKK